MRKTKQTRKKEHKAAVFVTSVWNNRCLCCRWCIFSHLFLYLWQTMFPHQCVHHMVITAHPHLSLRQSVWGHFNEVWTASWEQHGKVIQFSGGQPLTITVYSDRGGSELFKGEEWHWWSVFPPHNVPQLAPLPPSHTVCDWIAVTWNLTTLVWKEKGGLLHKGRIFKLRTISLYVGDGLSLREDCGDCTNRLELSILFIRLMR